MEMPVKKIVALGGGTGLPNVLKALSKLPFNSKAIVNVVDDGGSSGRLRQCLGVLPPGDARNCLVATATNKQLTEVFNYRFDTECELDQHSLGNLIIAGLSKMKNSFKTALDISAKNLGSQIEVVPATNEAITLSATTEDGAIIYGQKNIALRENISKVMLNPASPKADDSSLEAIDSADVLIIGPGSLFSSIIPSLLIPQIKEAISMSNAKKLFISNIVNFRKETLGMSLDEHIFALRDNCPYLKLDLIIAQDPKVLKRLLSRKHLKDVELLVSENKVSDVKIIFADLADNDNPKQHSDKKLAKILARVMNEL